MSFFRKLFGGGGAPSAEAGPAASAEHRGFSISATPYQEGGQWQLCGVVEKETGGETKSHRFIRADRFPGKEEAASAALAKGRQLIDERGEALFDA